MNESTKCPWCGEREVHEEYSCAVKARKGIAELNEKLYLSLDYHVKTLMRLRASIKYAAPGSDCIYPYCSKKCRYEAIEADEHEEWHMVSLLDFRSKVLQEIEAARKLAPELMAEFARLKAEGLAAHLAEERRTNLKLLPFLLFVMIFVCWLFWVCSAAYEL